MYLPSPSSSFAGSGKAFPWKKPTLTWEVNAFTYANPPSCTHTVGAPSCISSRTSSPHRRMTSNHFRAIAPSSPRSRPSHFSTAGSRSRPPGKVRKEGIARHSPVGEVDGRRLADTRRRGRGNGRAASPPSRLAAEEGRETDADQEAFRAEEPADRLAPGFSPVLDEHAIALLLQNGRGLHDVLDVELEPCLGSGNSGRPGILAEAGPRRLRK